MHKGTSVTSPGGLYAAEILVGGAPQPLYAAADGYLYVAGGSPDVLAVGYDTLAALEATGITARRPEPFPGRTTGYERYQA